MRHILSIWTGLAVCIVLGLIPPKGFARTAKPVKPVVLIVNFNSVNVKWSAEVSQAVADYVYHQYPMSTVLISHLNIDNTQWDDGPELSLRAALWNIMGADPVEKDAITADTHLLPQSRQADAIVLIGDEAYITFQKLKPDLGKWREVPLVLCAVNDSLTVRHFGNNPMTGVRVTLPIRENLQLIHHLLPDLKELVWVDNAYATSENARRSIQNNMPDILPGVQLKSVVHHADNTDSIIDAMTGIHDRTAFITMSWNLYNNSLSVRSEEQIRSLFNSFSFTPMFSLTEQHANYTYWVGGYYRPINGLIQQTISLLDQVLCGEPANQLPFVNVTGGNIKLDYNLLHRYHLFSKAKKLPKVTFVNPPPSFLEKYSIETMVFSIILLIAAGLIYIALKARSHDRQLRKESGRYKQLYDKLQTIYAHSNIDFALYNKDDRLVFRVMNQKNLSELFKDDLLLPHLTNHPYITAEEVGQVRQGQIVSKQVKLHLPESEEETYPNDIFTFQLTANLLKRGQYKGHILVAVIDVTQLTIFSEQRARISKMMSFVSESTDIGIFGYNIQEHRGRSTAQWCKNLNEQFIRGLASTFENVVADDRYAILKYRRKARKDPDIEPFAREIRVMKDGKEHWVRLHLFINKFDSNMLIGLNMNIDDEKERLLSLQSALERAEKSTIEKKLFLNSINHEIRTPLNAIVGFSAILSLLDEDSEEVIGLKDLIIRNNRLLTMLIDNIIELSELESGTIEFNIQPVDVNELYIQLNNMGYLQLYEKDLDIITQVHEDSVIYTDRDYFLRLAMHVMSNAIKFTNKGQIEMGIDRTPDRKSYYCYMQDTGCGIPPEELENVFKPFYKVNTYQQGTGLGLTICKSIVTRMGGSIGIESEVGVGTRLWLTLPIPDGFDS